MKCLVFILLFVAACGSKGGSSGASNAPGNPDQPAVPGENTYVMRLTGDSVQFTMLMIADQGLPQEEQVFTGAPVTIPAGQAVEFQATGATLKSIQVSRTGPQVPPMLNIYILRNGVQVGTGWLTTSGTFTNLPDQN